MILTLWLVECGVAADTSPVDLSGSGLWVSLANWIALSFSKVNEYTYTIDGGDNLEWRKMVRGSLAYDRLFENSGLRSKALWVDE